MTSIEAGACIAYLGNLFSSRFGAPLNDAETKLYVESILFGEVDITRAAIKAYRQESTAAKPNMGKFLAKVKVFHENAERQRTFTGDDDKAKAWAEHCARCERDWAFSAQWIAELSDAEIMEIVPFARTRGADVFSGVFRDAAHIRGSTFARGLLLAFAGTKAEAASEGSGI